MARALASRAMVCVASAAVAAASCDAPISDPREREIVDVLTRADASLILDRPELVRAKYEAMAESDFAFYRGTFPLFVHDASRGAIGPESSAFDREIFPFSIGDAHPENFGSLPGPDGVFAIEPNDFDAADRYPYAWEVRRLAVGLVLAVRASSPLDAEARAAATSHEREDAIAFARSYAETMTGLAAGAPRARLVDGAGSPVLEDVFERSVRDTASRRELEDRTEIIDGARSLVRGVVDPEDPTGVYSDAPSIVLEALPATLDRYRASLRHPPDPSFFTVKDAVREYGAGVASIPRARWVVLVEGATLAIDDDVLLEMKELADAPSPSVAPPGVFADDIQARVDAARRTCWVVPDEDPLWGTSELLGLPVQIKGDFDGYKTFRVHRLEKERGTPEALARWSEDLGRILATVHAGSERDFPGTVAAIAAAVDDADAFASEQADVAIAYADRVARDRALFTDALAALGPTLGLVPGEGDGLRPDARALIGSEDAP